MRVLITGFGPFPRAPFNPSAALVKALARRRRPALADIERSTHIFATIYAVVDRDLPQLFAGKPDVVLMFGLAARTRHLRIETRARNAVSVIFPDASGYRHAGAALAPAGPSALNGAAPFSRLLGALRQRRLPARLSRNAGNYLCNYAYWRALERAHGGAPLIQFIHIPSLRSKPRPRRRGTPARGRASSFADLVAAGEMLLIALVAARRR
jgi:pyroglutamyl-peptidase